MTLAPDEDGHLASRDIPDVEAFALYLRARQEFPRATEASLDLAQRLVERALARTGPNALLLATVEQFSDGDRVIAKPNAGTKLHLRLLGIEAPEIAHATRPSHPCTN